MSYLASFGSGMLEQSLKNKEDYIQRQYDLAKDLSPLVLQEIADKKKLIKAEEDTRNTLSQFYKPNEINLLASANKNILYSDDPLTDAKTLIDNMGGQSRFTNVAQNFDKEVSTNTQQELDNFKSFYTNNVAEQLGTGTSMLDFVLGNKSNTIENQETAQADTPEETVEQPMIDPVQTTSDRPILRDIAFSSTEAFVNSDAGKVALADKGQDKRADNMTTYQWLQTDVDINTGEAESQFTGSDFNPIPRKDYYTIEYNKQVAGSPQGNDVSQQQARIELEGGTQELNSQMRSYVQGIINSGDAEEARGAIEFLTSMGIPFAEEFPQLNVIASS